MPSGWGICCARAADYPAARAAELREAGVDVDVVVRGGSPAEQIIAEAAATMLHSPGAMQLRTLQTAGLLARDVPGTLAVVAGRNAAS